MRTTLFDYTATVTILGAQRKYEVLGMSLSARGPLLSTHDPVGSTTLKIPNKESWEFLQQAAGSKYVLFDNYRSVGAPIHVLEEILDLPDDVVADILLEPTPQSTAKADGALTTPMSLLFRACRFLDIKNITFASLSSDPFQIAFFGEEVVEHAAGTPIGEGL